MSQHDKDYTEKRDFIRMTIDAKVTLRYQGQEFEGVCHDLSSTGMQIRTDATAAVDDVLSVHLPSPSPLLDPLDVDAKVIRIDMGATGERILGLATTLVPAAE
jgi:hypothetical protein